MTGSENATETTDETQPVSAQEAGRRIADLVDEEAARIEAEEAAAEDAENMSYPCPVCGGDINLPAIPQQDPNKVRCSACNGYGMTATGSLTPEQQIDTCSACNGRGWVPVPPTIGAVPPVPAPVATDAHEETPVPTEFPKLEVPELPQLQNAS